MCGADDAILTDTKSRPLDAEDWPAWKTSRPHRDKKKKKDISSSALLTWAFLAFPSHAHAHTFRMLSMSAWPIARRSGRATDRACHRPNALALALRTAAAALRGERRFCRKVLVVGVKRWAALVRKALDIHVLVERLVAVIIAEHRAAAIVLVGHGSEPRAIRRAARPLLVMPWPAVKNGSNSKKKGQDARVRSVRSSVVIPGQAPKLAVTKPLARIVNGNSNFSKRQTRRFRRDGRCEV